MEKKPTKRLALIPARDDEQIRAISQLAQVIWREHYTSILGEDQVEYMLATLQSREKIGEDIASEKAAYYLMEAGGEQAGYLSIEWQKDTLFLSKLYLLKEARGQGLASQALLHLISWAKEQGKLEVELTVNKHNEDAIHFYEKMGFERIASVATPIGGGYMMDDHIYVYRLYPNE